MTARSGINMVLIGALLAYVAQVALASNLTILGVTADVALCFVIYLAFKTDSTTAVLTAFVLGMLVDLSCGSVLGARALSYCLVAFATGMLSATTMIENTAGRYAAMMVMAFAGELACALLLSIIGYDANLSYTLMTHMLPAGLYNSVICLLFLPGLRSGAPAYGTGSLGTPKSKRSLKETLPPVRQ